MCCTFDGGELVFSAVHNAFQFSPGKSAQAFLTAFCRNWKSNRCRICLRSEMGLSKLIHLRHSASRECELRQNKQGRQDRTKILPIKVSEGNLLGMSDQRKALHRLIEEARDEDLSLLAELVARFQRPLDFPLEPASTVSLQTGQARRRQELILEAQSHARGSHAFRQHNAKTAKRLGIDPALIESGAGSGSIGGGDVVEISRRWLEGPAFCRLNTFQMETREVITLDKSKIRIPGRR